MGISHHEAIEAAQEAERTLRMANIMLRKTAWMLPGRLKSAEIPDTVLCQLKKELSKYNSHTGVWK